jgi:pyridoxine/pyridoxamine 5'-phosphate oxidase
VSCSVARFDLGKNRENIERLLAALSELLVKTAPTVSPVAAREARGELAERIMKLKELAHQGLITSAEFDKRKSEILFEV